jgi:hypothetical protein
MEIAVSKDLEIKLNLFIPHAPYPSFSTADLLMDLWSHPILGAKWKPLLKQVDS